MIMLPILFESDKVERTTDVRHFYRLIRDCLFSLGIHWWPIIQNIYSTLFKFGFALQTPVICASFFSTICVPAKDTNTNAFFLVTVNLFSICDPPKYGTLFNNFASHNCLLWIP